MSANPKGVTFSIEATEWDVDAKGCWPDGEPPRWSADDVAVLLEEHNSLTEFLRAWCLTDRIRVRVTDTTGAHAEVDL